MLAPQMTMPTTAAAVSASVCAGFRGFTYASVPGLIGGGDRLTGCRGVRKVTGPAGKLLQPKSKVGGIRYGGRVIEVRQPTPADLEALADILSAAELGCGPVGAHVIDPGSAHVIEPVLGGPG